MPIADGLPGILDNGFDRVDPTVCAYKFAMSGMDCASELQQRLGSLANTATQILLDCTMVCVRALELEHVTYRALEED